MRWNKGNILKAAVDHIRKLHSRQERQTRSDDRSKKMEAMNRQLMVRLQECENAMRSNGIEVPDMPERDDFINQLGGNENMQDDDLESAPSPGDIMSLNDDLQSTHSMQSQNFMSSPRRIGASEPKPMGQSALQQSSSLNQVQLQHIHLVPSSATTNSLINNTALNYPSQSEPICQTDPLYGMFY